MAHFQMTTGAHPSRAQQCSKYRDARSYRKLLRPRTAALLIFAASFVLTVAGCRTPSGTPEKAETWRGIHVPVYSDDQLSKLEGQLPQLAADGANMLVLQVDYHFDFRSHPELRDQPFITKVGARKFIKAARKLSIRVIPELDCLGHQSIHDKTMPLLAKYPQFDETPGLYPGNKDIYCRSWCPQSPGLNPIIFSVIDELTDAFQSDAFHVGMDEVFFMADEHCPRCHGQDPAKLFAESVNDLHQHIVGDRKLTMLMWGDRLLDAQTMHYGKWESATNGTAPAVDLIPKDIILCDWHYRAQTNYPSVPFFLNKGFRVWPSGFQPAEGAKALSEFSLQQRTRNTNVIGYLATTWSRSKTVDLATWPPITDNLPAWINK